MAHQIILELPLVEFENFHDKNYLQFNTDDGSGKIKAIPVIINFQRLLANPKLHNDVFQGISNKELLHAVAALYDQSLPEVTEDIIYGAVCEKWARTVLLVWEREQSFEYFKVKALHTMTSELSNQTNNVSDQVENVGVQISAKRKEEDSKFASKTENGTENANENCELPEKIKPSLKEESINKQESEKIIGNDSQMVDNISLENSDTTPLSGEIKQTLPVKEEESRFADVFSDMESSEGEEEEESEDYLSGVDEFLANVKQRREDKKKWLNSLKSQNCLGEPTSLVGIEHRLLACATFEKSYDKPGHKVVQLTLIATRKRFRKMGLGRFMTRIVRNPVLAGKYDVVVVNADHNATDFFEKEGFTDDILANSKYAEIGDTWFNCKRMCYLPPYQSAFESMENSQQVVPDIFLTELEDLDLKQMELDIALFQEKSLQAFQAQASIVQRLRKEIILLRARVANQLDTIQVLTKENETIRDEKFACEKKLLRLRLKTMSNAADKLFDFDDDEEADSVMRKSENLKSEDET